MDVTEAFENYHLSDMPLKVLENYFIKNADLPRNYNFTFKDDGFFRALKTRVIERMPSVDKSVVWKSNLCMDLIIAGFLMASILIARVESIYLKIIFVLIAGQFGGWMAAAVHNFYHQKNNWRMYVANFLLVGWREWRVFHVLVRREI
jgi:hypothetical protein